MELFVNGRALGRQPVGEDHRFRTEFDTVYQPGELLAIAYRDASNPAAAPSPPQRACGARAEVDRLVLRAPGTGGLAYVTLTLTGICRTHADRSVRVDVSSAGVLCGFGSADPSTEERFDATERRTYGGRSLAVIRPTRTGKIRLVATVPESDVVEIIIAVV